MIDFNTIFFALVGGFLPALLWLWFWLREDKKRPEPRGLLILTFVLGMASVAVVLPLENFAYEHIQSVGLLIIAWAVFEEVFKYIAGYFGGIRHRAMDEPVDALIYMITAALGFAALENALFLIGPLSEGNTALALITGNVRFIGATLLHTASSAIIGISIAFSFYKSKRVRIEYLAIGFALAIGLHALFNKFIIDTDGSALFPVFVAVWIVIVVVIVLFERVKRIRAK